MNNFILFEIDSDYCNYLRKFDNKVMLNKDNQNSNKRPYIGIVLEINNNKYFAPLTSPKDKHKKQMKKHSIDMILINNGTYGAINLNNMIPVPESHLEKIDINILPTDSKEEKEYKNLLIDQQSWCDSNSEKIIRKANNLYKLINSNYTDEKLKNRCCNFKQDELYMKEYQNQHTNTQNHSFTI